jgi:serine/threonine protein kinase/WD40 repeat protein
MSDQAIHPSPEELSAFSLGQLPPDAAAEVECHIRECEPCCETMLGLSSGDTFIAMLQEAKQLPTDQTLAQARQSVSDRSLMSEIPKALTEHPRYEIVHLVGKGGMGDVYQARHRMMERTVAIKIINRELMRKPEAVDRFHREVKTAASLSHPNIVTAHDAEQAGDVHFLVMEFVDGVDLARMVREHGPLPIAKACDYIQQAARGLQYAHDRGMVHRDIKPHNLMVTPDGMLKILDFGLATLSPDAIVSVDATSTTSALTAAGSIMGTPDFIAPEQAVDAHQADIRSDIYSLGATLYYLLSGRAPFAEESVMHKLKSHAEVEPKPIEHVQVDVPAELAEVLRRMMAKNPAERFQTPEEVANVLAPLVDRYRTDPSIKEPKPMAEPMRQPPRTWIKLALGALAIILAGVIYVVDDTGTLVIESEDENVEITVRPLTHQSHEGEKHSRVMQYLVGDTTTGSTVTRLRSGAYIVDLKGRENEYELSQDRFILKRGGKVIVTVTRRDDTEVARAKAAPQAVQIPRVHLPMQVFSGSEATRGITAMAVSADGKQLLAGNHGGGIGVWDIASGKQLRSLDGHKGMVHSIDISSDGRFAVTGSEEPLETEAGPAHGSTKKSGMSIVWDLTTGEKFRELDSHHARVQVVRFSPDDKLILTVNADFADNRENSAWLWNAADGTLVRQLDINHEWIVDAEFSPDGSRIAGAGQKKCCVVIFDVASGKRVHLLPQVQGSLNSVAFSPDGRYLAAGHKGPSPASGTWRDSDGCVLRMYDATTFEHIRTFQGHAGPVVDAAFSPDGRWLLSVASGAHDKHGIWRESSDNSARLWNVATGKELARFEVGDRTNVVAFTHDGMGIVTGGVGSLGLRLWSLPEELTTQAPPRQPGRRRQ